MPRQKKQHLKRRKDGRFCAVYHGKQLMGWTEEEAFQAREEYKKQLEREEYISENPTISQYAEKWLKREKHGVSDQTYREAAILLEKLTDSIGNKYPREVKPSEIKDIYVKKLSGKSDSYIRAGAQLYRALFDALMEDGLCKSNPARQKSSKPPSGYKHGHRAITQQEREWIETLCTNHRAHAAVMAMLYAGIRPQEAKALDISRDVDSKAEIITVRESVHLDGYNTYVRNETLKTEYSKREIPLFTPLKKALDGRSGMLIQSASGKAVTVQAWRSVWESYVSSLETAINGCQERWYGRRKQDKGKELPPFIHVTFTPYDLRHSFCTMCRDNGVELNTCIHWMGHADAKMILKIYDEFSTERSKKEAKKLEKTLFHMQIDMQPEQGEAKTTDATSETKP